MQKNITTITPENQQVSSDDFFTKVRNSIRKDKRLDGNAKILFGMIESLALKDGYCWSTNDWFAEQFDVSPATVRRWVRQIEAAGYITVKYPKSRKGTERRIHMGDILRPPRDSSPEVVAEVLQSIAMSESKGDSRRGDNSGTPAITGTPGVTKSAGQGYQPFYPRGTNSGTQLDTVLESGKENRKDTSLTPPAPKVGGAAFGAVSLSLLEQEAVKEQEVERKRQERERSEAEWLVKVEEQKQKNADQKLFIKAFNQIAKEVKDNPPLSLAELDRLRTERHQKLKAEAASLTAEAAKGETL